MTLRPGHRFVFGVGPVKALLAARAREIVCVYAQPARAARGGGDPVADIARAARARGIEVETRSRAELDALVGAGVRHQGVVAVAGAYPYADEEEILAEAARRGEPPLVVALDGVTDPRNLGAILRSAYLLGAHGVIVPRDRAAAVSAVAAKTSAGASEHLLVAQVTNLARALAALKQQGLWVAAIAAGERSRPIWEIDGRGPLCVVLGSEGKGLRPLVAKGCDLLFEIPMRGAAVDSLNVSVAASVALYEIARQRGTHSGRRDRT